MVDIQQETMWKNIKNLTMREKEIFSDMCKLMDYKEISEKRDISQRTAKYHAMNIYKKLGIDDICRPHEQKRLKFLKIFCEVTPKDFGEAS